MLLNPLSKTEFFHHFTDEDNWTIALSRINDFLQSIKKYRGITNKSKSEMISAMVLQELAEVVDSKITATCRTATTDNQPDIMLFIRELMFAAGEGKAAKAKTGTNNDSNVTWRGGEFSKRDGDYFFITWDYTDNTQTNLKWFVCYAYITKDDWTSSIQNGYYATSITAETILAKHNPIIIIGDKTESKQGNPRLLLKEIV